MYRSEEWLLISQGGVIVMLVFVCLTDCLCVCVCVYVCPQPSITSLSVGQELSCKKRGSQEQLLRTSADNCHACVYLDGDCCQFLVLSENKTYY